VQEQNRRPTSSIANPSFGFPFADRVRFVAEYILSRLFYIWREVKNPRLRLFAYETPYNSCWTRRAEVPERRSG
jgi:hypothetical protein